MPLSVPESGREEIYFRHIDYTGYRREGVLWDIEGHLKDLRSADFPCVERGGFIRAGEAFHEMRLRLTVDDDLKIHGIEAVVENSPFKICPCTQAIFQKIVGLTICPGFIKEVRARIPVKLGCTHLFDLLLGTASAAFQTVGQVRYFKYCRGLKPDMIDTCLAWDSAGDVVKREWPDYYTGAQEDKAG